MKKLTIAIDGHASTGKSSIAKEIALKYGYIYINSGSMYRAVTLFAIKNNLLDELNENIDLFIEKLNTVSINFRFNKINLISEIFLNGRNVEKEIGSLEISNFVSKVAAIPEIRKEMVKLQRNIPDADIKLFLTASETVRAKRRFEEMINNGFSVSYDDILNNIRIRDNLDSSRSDSPLTIEKDAVVIDNSNMSIDEQIKHIIHLIDNKIVN